ncbi:WD40 repeat domain-containing protein [Hymenobacter sp. BT730]|uniref:WD40 repeat domain-containing protein n=1 Tax=Hymenobacter sp. BT730 TaxID=3063332 RepID=UPI0026E03837|nr:WD40 repeat domain-containing protein [Hymenobacter sp. BT730]
MPSILTPARRFKVVPLFVVLTLLLGVVLLYQHLHRAPAQTNSGLFKLHKVLTSHKAHVWEVVYSPDNQVLASCGIDSTVLLWDKEGTLLRRLKHPIGVTAMAFSPDGQYLATGCYDDQVRFWRVADGTLAATLPGHTGTVWSVAFSPDGRYLASTGEDKTIRLWAVAGASATPARTLKGHKLNIWSVAFSPDSRQLASGSFDDTIKLWNVATGALERTITGHTQAVLSVAYSPDGRQLASGSDDKTVKIWSLPEGRLVRTLTGEAECVYGIAYSPDGRQLASSSRDRSEIGEIWQHFVGSAQLPNGVTVRLWDTASGQLLQTFAEHTDDAHDVAFSPDGNWLASASADNTVHIWQRAH